MRKIPGITREEEEAFLRRVKKIAKAKVEANKENIKALAEELHAMQEEFDESDKEMQTLWHDADARFKFVNQDLERAKQAEKKPYFGRIDYYGDRPENAEALYIGRSVIAKNAADPEVIDWRAPIAGVYYDAQVGPASYSVKGEGRYDITLTRKRTYEIEGDALKDFYDSDVVANDELLTKYLAKNKKAVLGEIIATIQQEQNQVIRKKPQHNLIVQGAAGSGKTTVAMHRISYILYNYELEFAPEDFYIIGSNQVLLNYITGVLPELNVYGVRQMTMEQLFIRLLYEEWDRSYKVVPIEKGVTPPIKGTQKWFKQLEAFCHRYEYENIPREDVVLEKNGKLLLSAEAIETILENSREYSRADKITRLTEHLMAKLENEISGRYYSYTPAEKDKLTRFYSTYFGKREWKGSIFELYEKFLMEQAGKGNVVPVPENHTFDVYDLAALAYLYKRIKEDEIIREAGHVVIDEAQDFGMMAYCSLKYCLSKCTYTIMGDVSQNISLEYGLNDWTELRKLMLPGDYDYFGVLRKSYRNTIEISGFASDILAHGSFPLYPMEPIIRHGNAVTVKECKTAKQLEEQAADILKQWVADGMETIAVICASEEEAAQCSKALAGYVKLESFEKEGTEFKEGIMVLPLAYTKGLEFDAVLLYNVNDTAYPLEDWAVKRLYVAATRALHELAVLYQGKVSGILSAPIPEGKKDQAKLQIGSRKEAFVRPEDTRTKAEIYREDAILAEKQREERGKYGPKKIEISAAQKVSMVHEKSFAPKGGSTVLHKSYLEQIREELDAKRVTAKEETRKRIVSEFGDMPDTAKLSIPGHAKMDYSIKLVMKNSGCLDFLSAAGTLRITPLSQELVRICFVKGQGKSFPHPANQYAKMTTRFRVKESPSFAEIMLEKLTVHVDKKTGLVSFYNNKGKVILAESAKDSRVIVNNAVWQQFDWKHEELIADSDVPGKTLSIGKSARCISFGRESDKLPMLASSAGYEISLPSPFKTTICTIPAYGNYLCQEGTETIEYYVKAK